MGDWFLKYERMGECMTDGGVCGFVGEEELAESDDADEMDNERDLLRVPIGMGSERVWFDFSFEDILRERKIRGRRKIQFALESDFIWRSFFTLIIYHVTLTTSNTLTSP